MAGLLHVAGADASRARSSPSSCAEPVATATAPADRPLDCSLDSSRARALDPHEAARGPRGAG